MISLVQFLQKGKIDKVCRILRESRIAPKWFIFGIRKYSGGAGRESIESHQSSMYLNYKVDY